MQIKFSADEFDEDDFAETSAEHQPAMTMVAI